MALSNLSISFSKSHQQVSLQHGTEDHSDSGSNCSTSTHSTPAQERKQFIANNGKPDTKAQQQITNDPLGPRSRASSNQSLNSLSAPNNSSLINSTSNESLSVQELIKKEKLLSEQLEEPIEVQPNKDTEPSQDSSSASAEQAEEAFDALLDEQSNARSKPTEERQNQNEPFIISLLWPIITSPSVAVAVIVVALMLTRFNADFLLGALTATIVSPLVAYLLIRFLLFSKRDQANFDDPTSPDYLETATRTDNEISGWVYIREGKERKPVYLRLRDRQLKLSYKDTTSRIIEIHPGIRLQLVSPYTKSKKRLKHLFNKNLPLVIVDNGDPLVIFFREAKQKETWFWSLYPLFYPYDAEQLMQKNVAAQLASKSNNNQGDHRDWFNLLLSRAFRDFISHFKWRRWIRRKCQQKLRKLPLPQFIDPLRVRKVTLSSRFPKLSNPDGHRDTDGQALLSFELDASPMDGEESVFEMTLETKINASFFTNYKEEDSRSNDEFIGLSDDEEEDQEVSFDTVSSSSEDEEEQFEQLPLDGETLSIDEESMKTSHSADSLLTEKVEKKAETELSASPSSNQLSKSPAPKSFLDKLRVKGSVLLNKNKTVRKYFDELVSSSQLTLTVKVLSLKGRLLLAQPSWPSDRVWFKMAPRPDLKLSVHLKHGNHQKPLLKSAWLKNQLEERLRRHLVQVMCTYDDVALHPLLVLPSTRFYAINKQALDATNSFFVSRI